MKKDMLNDLFTVGLFLTAFTFGLIVLGNTLVWIAVKYDSYQTDRIRAEERRERRRAREGARRNREIVAALDRAKEDRHQSFCAETCGALWYRPLWHSHTRVEGMSETTPATCAENRVLCRCLSESPDGRFRTIHVLDETKRPMFSDRLDLP